MRVEAVRFTGKGGVEVIAMGELDVREPGQGEVQVEIVAAGVNRADLLQRRGLYPAPAGAPADVPGLELAGHVVARGPAATLFELGHGDDLDPALAGEADGLDPHRRAPWWRGMAIRTSSGSRPRR